MADYTISTTVRQEAILSYVVGIENAKRATQGLPAINNTQYMNAIYNNIIKDYIRQYWEADVNNVKGAVDTKWEDLTSTQRNNIKTILGLP